IRDRTVTGAQTCALPLLDQEVKNAEIFYQHIQWLHERFPKAEYEDVTGLCKLASPAEVKEQEYSLNPGRYVGVVIEEDGKTEEEFIEEMLRLDSYLATLHSAALKLQATVSTNIKKLTDDE